ncbi:hypothetical protein DENSPDRAFT_584333 [Dentipellis sp. KUC8613]|nr:hypothetical protein DENSPDRAFT_584333 [Dentipellis sp. KUC8613]
MPRSHFIPLSCLTSHSGLRIRAPSMALGTSRLGRGSVRMPCNALIPRRAWPQTGIADSGAHTTPICRTYNRYRQRLRCPSCGIYAHLCCREAHAGLLVKESKQLQSSRALQLPQPQASSRTDTMHASMKYPPAVR